MLRRISIRFRMTLYAVLTATVTVGILFGAVLVQDRLQQSAASVLAETKAAQEMAAGLDRLHAQAGALIDRITSAENRAELDEAAHQFKQIDIPESVADRSSNGLDAIVQNHLVPSRSTLLEIQDRRTAIERDLIAAQQAAISEVRDLAANLQFDMLITVAEASEQAGSLLDDGSSRVGDSLEALGVEVATGLESIKSTQALSHLLSRLELLWTRAQQLDRATDIEYIAIDTEEVHEQCTKLAEDLGDRSGVEQLHQGITGVTEGALVVLRQIRSGLEQREDVSALRIQMAPLVEELGELERRNVTLSENVYFDVIIGIEEMRQAIMDLLVANNLTMTDQLADLEATVERSLASMSAIAAVRTEMLRMVNQTQQLAATRTLQSVSYLRSDLETTFALIERSTGELEDQLGRRILGLVEPLVDMSWRLSETQSTYLHARRRVGIISGSILRSSASDAKLGLALQDIRVEAGLPTVTAAERRLRERMASKQLETQDRMSALVNESNRSASQLTRLMIWTGGVAVVICIIMGRFIGSSMVRPLAQAVALGDAIRRGDFSQRLRSTSHDELGRLGMALDAMADSLQSTMETNHRLQEHMRAVIEEAARVGDQQQAAAGSLGRISMDMASSAEKTSSQAQLVASKAEHVNTSVTNVAAGIEQMSANSSEISANVSQAVDVSRNGRSLSEKVTEDMGSLSSAADRIDGVTHFILQIANQTHMLALNASIQAASAGAAGAGFAVVANEIKALAAEANSAISQINETIQQLKRSISESVDATSQVTETMNQINATQENIAAAMIQQNETVHLLAENVARAASACTAITTSIAEVAEEAKDNADLSGQTKHYASELTQLAHELGEVMKRKD